MNKYITFSVIFYRKNIGNKVIIYKLKSIDSFRFISVNLSEINRNIPLNKLIEKVPNTHQFCNKNINKFALLLKKSAHPCEYIDTKEKFNETSLPNKEFFYSRLNKKNITDEDYPHAQKIWKMFEITDIFENFRDRCIDIYKLDPAYFLSAPGLAW